MNTFLKTTAALTFALGCVLPSSAQQQTVSPTLKKNLEILRDILQKSTRHTPQGSLSRFDLNYIADKGVFFESRIEGGSSSWMFGGLDPAFQARINEEAMRVQQAVMAGNDVDESALEQLTSEAEAMAERAVEQQQTAQEKLRSLREERREAERELRDIEREKRDLEFTRQMEKTTPEQQKKLTELTKRQTEAQEKANKSRQQYEQAEQALRKEQAEQQKQALAKQQEFIQQLGSLFAQTLCDYGASLRELSDSQFVALKVETRGRNQQDVYWIFQKSDINQCVTGKLSAANLLKKVNFYSY